MVSNDAWKPYLARVRANASRFKSSKHLEIACFWMDTIYLMRRLRSDTLKAAGEVVGITKNSTVSSIIDRVKYEMGRNKGVRLRVEKLIKNLSNSQT